jgi:hypothetical protein
MCSAASRRAAVVLAALVLTTAWAARVAASDKTPTTGHDPLMLQPGRTADNDIIDARRRAVRTVATVSLVLILILIVLVVLLMIANRRLRAQYLGWHRKIRFKKLWDVWWSKEPPKE